MSVGSGARPMAKRIYLVRHGKAAGQEPEAPLTAEGVRQARELVRFFEDRHIEFIVSSPYVRAVETIRPLAERLGLDIRTDHRLKERVLSSAPLDDWMTRLEETFRTPDLKFEGGESSREAAERGLAVIRELAERPENAMVAVSHGGLLALLIRHYDPSFGFTEWKRMTNPDVYELEIGDGGASVRRWTL